MLPLTSHKRFYTAPDDAAYRRIMKRAFGIVMK